MIGRRGGPVHKALAATISRLNVGNVPSGSCDFFETKSLGYAKLNASAAMLRKRKYRENIMTVMQDKSKRCKRRDVRCI